MLELASKHYLFTELYNGGHLQSIEIWLFIFACKLRAVTVSSFMSINYC